ncbi:hypothetical protein PIB30_086638 [Stylosanthes scabra]|uniref:Uncharacterized protein n=1 Tax=Stylosanthes scabra TaxID=79078 RepID=A0ABU6STG4_9FABA|nr:hypothetical protein [Stylosanthes scabra]
MARIYHSLACSNREQIRNYSGKSNSDSFNHEKRRTDNIAVIAQGLHGKGKLGFPSTIYKLYKDARVPMREFKRTSRIPQEKPITAKRMETTRLPRNVPQQQQDEDDKEEPMPQAGGGNEEDQDQQQYHKFQQPPQHYYQEF